MALNTTTKTMLEFHLGRILVTLREEYTQFGSSSLNDAAADYAVELVSSMGMVAPGEEADDSIGEFPNDTFVQTLFEILELWNPDFAERLIQNI